MTTKRKAGGISGGEEKNNAMYSSFFDAPILSSPRVQMTPLLNLSSSRIVAKHYDFDGIEPTPRTRSVRDTQLGDVFQICFSELLPIDVIIDIDRVLPDISAELLD